MALCTKPPKPFVGDAGRSNLSGEIRPCDGDILSSESKLGGSSLCALVSGTGDPIPPEIAGVDRYELLEPLPEVTLLLVGEADLSVGSSNVSSGCWPPRANPGNCIREEFDPWSDLFSSST